MWTMRTRDDLDPSERIAPRIRNELAPLVAALAQETDRTRRRDLQRDLRAKRRELLTPQPPTAVGRAVIPPPARSCRVLREPA